MKRPLQLSLAIALALGVTDAFALGLGAIQVRSGLNQPLVAEIPVIQGTPGEAEGLLVQLASAEDFERVGMNRSSMGVPIEFALGKNARGEPVIRITSKDIVREPFLGFLVEANWPKGRLLREYTVLLDPPIMAPAVKGSSAVAVASREPERAPTQSLPENRPAPAAKPMAAKPAAEKPVVARSEPVSKPSAAPRQASGSEYGPVAAGETLGEIARATRPSESVSVNQMMLALLKSNPGSFYRGNINALKRGAVLRIPSSDEISATGSARDAAAAVRSQIDEWRGGAAAAPTLVADTSAAPSVVAKSAASAPTASRGERLALVPPREGKAGEQAADRPGGGSTGGTGDAATKAELARVKEALTSREQESGELKSRVKDLEDIKGKNDKLISLQNSELAELRVKLKAMQDAPGKPAAAMAAAAPVPAAPALSTALPPPSTSSAMPPASDSKISKDDIWGEGDKAGAGKPTSAASDPATAASTPATPTVETPVGATSPSSDAPVTMTPPIDTVASTPAPLAATTPAEPVKPDTTSGKPAAPVKKAVAAPPKPVVAETPWYMEPWALGAAGVGGLLLVLLGVAGMRKRKVADSTVARPSIAGSFGDSPVGDSFTVASHGDAEEAQLLEQVRLDPGNAGAHLELLSLYYSQREADKFEVAAEEMYAYVADPSQSEWREARAMGEDLVPHNPLFGGASDLSHMAGESRDRTSEEREFSFDEPPETYHFDESPPAAAASNAFETSAMPPVDFEYEAPLPSARAASDSSFSFDLPPLDPVADAPMITEYDLDPEEPAAVVNDDEFFAGEDAIGTKLDLAKAYLDMGDPDGARAMLEEVLAEGTAAQQGEARKLIGEIR